MVAPSFLVGSNSNAQKLQLGHNLIGVKGNMLPSKYLSIFINSDNYLRCTVSNLIKRKRLRISCNVLWEFRATF